MTATSGEAASVHTFSHGTEASGMRYSSSLVRCALELEDQFSIFSEHIIRIQKPSLRTSMCEGRCLVIKSDAMRNKVFTNEAYKLSVNDIETTH